MQLSILLILLSGLVTFTLAMSVLHTDTTRNEVLYKDGNSNRKTSEELASIFRSSIIYWDFEKSEHISNSVKKEMKQEIMNELVHLSPDSESCICSKILGPLVCDNTGILHSSICRFHCKFARKENEAVGLTPIMILAETSFQKSKKMCQQWFRGEERWSTAPVVNAE